MASTASVTVTGTSGAGKTITAGVFAGVTQFGFAPGNAMFEMTLASGFIERIAISAATTVTITLSAAAGNYTVTIS